MSAIAGYVDYGGPQAPVEACRAVLGRLVAFGPDRQQVRQVGETCFGHALKSVLPEDDHDRQPLLCQGGATLLTADIRIDNREEIVERVGLGAERARAMADADLLAASWEKWRLACVDQLLGDYVFAVWESERQVLTLVRGPLSSKPLFFCRSPRFTAFATMPSALFAVRALQRAVDLDELAAVVSGAALTSEATLFKDIRRVEPGTAVTIASAGEQVRRIWRLAPRESPTTLEAAGEGLRAELDRAVRAQLRRRSGPIATHLSSGRDSSAVTASAAHALLPAGAPLIALTGAPRCGFADGIDRGWLSDESGVAAETSSHLPNVVHQICRTHPADVRTLVDRVQTNHFGPMMNAYSAPWWNDTIAAAARAKAGVLLIGQFGNLSISRGGFDALDDLRVTAGVVPWLRTARAMTLRTGLRWQGVAYVSAAPLLHPWLHRVARRIAGRHDSLPFALPLLRGELRRTAERLGHSRRNALRTASAYREEVAQRIYSADNADLFALAAYGIDVRDPTADRRVVEYCHSLTPAQLVSVDSNRPAFEAAFANRLPRAVIEGRRRGFQAADWFEVFRPESIRTALRGYAENGLVRDLFDVKAIDSLIDGWPTSRGYDAENIAKYGQGLLNTLAVAGFIAVHFQA